MSLRRTLGIAFIIAALLFSVYAYALPLLYKNVEIHITSKIYKGFWVEAGPDYPATGVEITHIVPNKMVKMSINRSDVKGLKLLELYYRYDYVPPWENDTMYWRVTVRVDGNATGNIKVLLDYGCYIAVDDAEGYHIAGDSLGCSDFYDREVATIPVGSTGVFYVENVYGLSRGVPPNYPPWARFNIEFNIEGEIGKTYTLNIEIRYEPAG
ncbi:hypothetical protein DRJ17_07120 [Candidatus Woesearchaeota archaeon]|nr:MAG: hypothetical protein DRJ17_07120 [Candidatus Woesearchaeota archaeon]